MSRAVYACDVLVIGGGLAGCWAAIAAARDGAAVILAEKGYVGTSGVTATAGPGHWWVPPEPGVREKAVAERAERGLGLADPEWMMRIIDLTWRTLPTLSKHYLFHTENGVTQYRGMRGPEYMRAMRSLAVEAGVRILDQSPTHELLVDAEGAVAGALGEHRQQGGGPWEIRAGAVVVATGGCAFFSHLLGSRTNTGDGYLMAAEAGAQLSGMEFSSYYTVAPARSTMTRSMAYTFARYFGEDGRELDISPRPDVTEKLARAMMRGKVFCSLERVPGDIQAIMAHVQPNFVIPFDRWRLDPYRDRFEVTLQGEGTVRGIGGLKVVDDDCRTTVPGLFAAGDAATRERIAGAVSGGGAQNSAWALSSGQWAGQGASRYAGQARPDRSAHSAAPSTGQHSDLSAAEVVAAVRDEMETPAKNMFRSEGQLGRSLARMDDLWATLKTQSIGARWQTRELTAAVAAARWSLSAAMRRTESRGMHRRTDYPATDAGQAHRLNVSGTDTIVVGTSAVLQLEAVG